MLTSLDGESIYDRVIDSSTLLPDIYDDDESGSASASAAIRGGAPPSGLPVLSKGPTGRDIVKGTARSTIAVNYTQSPPFAGTTIFMAPSLVSVDVALLA
jgi:hypothetical protein